MGELVLINQINPQIAVISLNRPQKRNALSIELMQELKEVMLTCENDKQIRVIILKGEGPVFCAGLDLSQAQDESLTERSSESLKSLYHTIYTSRLVTLACVHGAVMAGGAGLMCACDFVIAEEKTQFAFPETKRGLVPAQIAVFLTRQVLDRALRKILLTGDVFDAKKALEFGLITEIAKDKDSMQQAINLAEKVLKSAPESTILTKKLIQSLNPADFELDQNDVHEIHKLARNSSEAKEGIEAFFNKRDPKWLK